MGKLAQELGATRFAGTETKNICRVEVHRVHREIIMSEATTKHNKVKSLPAEPEATPREGK